MMYIYVYGYVLYNQQRFGSVVRFESVKLKLFKTEPFKKKKLKLEPNQPWFETKKWCLKPNHFKKSKLNPNHEVI